MTETAFLDGRVVLHAGDCRDVIRSLPDASIDSCVTDPPYALVSIGRRFGADNAAPAKPGKTGAYQRASAGFMGKRWDTGKVAFDPDFWAEVLRVLKPGAHLVAFGGTRSYHRLACAIEDAGFEIRDQLAWVYGSGFPKNHDVSKGIAKRRTEDVEPVRVVCRFIRSAMDSLGLKSSDLTGHFGGCNARLIDHWAARDSDSQPSLPTMSQWETLNAVLRLASRAGFDAIAESVQRLNARKGTHGARWAEAEVIGEGVGASPGFGADRFTGDRSIRALDEEAATWEGWGTALKPAWEPIVLARKPLIGTVAETVLAHGTGALNIDGCRIEWPSGHAPEIGTPGWGGPGKKLTAVPGQSGETVERAPPNGAGRWPANIVHDGSDEVLAAFPDTGPAKAADKGARPAMLQGGRLLPDGGVRGHDDAGGSAARFFYSAKADANDRIGSKHPTVKPVDLMQWLCRLVTPPSGLVCEKCGTRVHGNRAKNASEAEALRGVRNDVSPDGQSGTSALLFEGMREQFDEAEAPPVRGVSGDISSDGLGAEILRATVRPAMDGEESVDDEGLRHDQEGVPAASYAQPSAGETRVHSRASVRRGAEDRTPVNGGRGGASHQRHKDGQSSRELAVDAKDRSRQDQPASTEHDCMPVLRNGHDDQPPCPHCGGKVSFRHSVILDPFAGTGTTGEAAFREGFKAVLIEREAEYRADIARRMELALAGPDERARESLKARGKADYDAGPLFGGEAA